MKRYKVNMIHEELIEVEVEAENDAEAVKNALKGRYDNWVVKNTYFKEVVSVEEREDQ